MEKKGSKKNTLYTGHGDSGTTTLFHCDQGRISKSANIIEALGTLDELNAYLGIIKVQSEINSFNLKVNKKNIQYSKIIENIQQKLFIIQAEVAGSDISVGKNDLKEIELIIKYISESIPPIKSFTISGGSLLSSELDFSRTLARRAERYIVKVKEEGFKKLNPVTISYMNRLSSILFAMSRYANHILAIPETHPKYNK
jgi:cob(I)alamin adenosyltransferase